MSAALDRTDVIDGLTEVVRRLRDRGAVVLLAINLRGVAVAVATTKTFVVVRS